MRRHRVPWIWPAFVLLLASCSDRGTNPRIEFVAPVPGQGGAGEELELNQRLWKSSGIDSYSYRFRWECYCIPSYVRTVDITVREGAIISVIDAETREVLAGDAAAHYRTIEQLFGFIREAKDMAAVRINVIYDKNLGYPYEVFVDYHAAMIDEEKGFRVYGLVVHRGS